MVAAAVVVAAVAAAAASCLLIPGLERQFHAPHAECLLEERDRLE